MKLPYGFQPVNAVDKIYADITGVPMPTGIDVEPDEGSDDGSNDDNEGSGD